MKRRDIVLDTVRSLTQQRGGEARSWLVAARTYDRAEEINDRLAALDKALELNPECIDAFDLRASSLAAAGRWDEAYAACRPTVFNGKIPTELQARSARISAQRGDRRRAIAEMKQVVAASPATFAYWASLSEWCVAANDAPGSLEAAEAMVRIAPQYEYS
jgi:tetratricopeptide (TPR) repeat protein